MASTLFRYMPAVMYRGLGAPNIMQRLRLPEAVINNALLFHKYVVVDGDRPDTIASHYYGSPLYDWVVALSNQMTDVYSEWPLTQQELDDVIAAEYGSTSAASATIDHYKLKRNIDQINEVQFDALPASLKKYWTKVSVTSDAFYNVRPSDITITPASYADLPVGENVYWEPVTAYDRFFEENEAKRAIKLIDAQAVPELEKALRLASNV